MKKYIILTALTITLGGALAGCKAGKDIGQEEAKKAAFQDAGIQETDVSRVRVSKEQDDGMLSYDVEFHAGDKEYSYEIKASDGSILSSDIETLYTEAPIENQEINQDQQLTEDETGNTANNNASQVPTLAISEADAKKAALERVPGAVEQDLRMELEYDDGRYVYEGDIYYQQKEYEFEIDANNGNFLKWSEERD